MRTARATTVALGALLAAVATLTGCPRPALEAGAKVETASPAASVPLGARLGTGDVFEVRVFEEPDLSGVFRVGPDGTIDFPFCGRLNVRGETTSALATRLVTCLANGYLRHPQVTVTAKEYNSKKVLVYGKVQKPGVFPYTDDMSIVDAIVLAGGFAQFASGNGTSVIRPTATGEERFKVAVEDIGTGRAPNFYLRPGDVVFVPESWK